MSSKTKKDWEKLFAFRNDEEKIDFISSVISSSIAYNIEGLLKKRKLSKKELAQKIGTSASYITQIMTGDKLINMKFLAKLKFYLEVDFSVEIIDTLQNICTVTDFSDWLVIESKATSVKKVGDENVHKAG